MKIKVVFILMLFSLSTMFSQGDPCPTGANCVSQDIQNVGFFVGDSLGNPLVTSCTPGDPVSAFIYTRFDVNASNRYDINAYGDIYIDGVYSATFDQCLGDFGSANNTHNVQVAAIQYTCGEALLVQNTTFSWNVQNSPNGTCETCNTPKCKQEAPIIVDAPLVANFSSSSACPTGNSFEQFTFTDSTTGGITPYSYAWSFGTGATPATATGAGPHVVSYNSTGNRTVTVTVTDSDAPSNSDDQSYVIDVAACCTFSTTCPTFTPNPTIVDCYADIPTQSTYTEAQFEALGNGDGDIDDSPCGVIEITASNEAAPACEGTIIRTYTVTEYEDADGNGVKDLPEVILNTLDCNETFTIEYEDFIMPADVNHLPIITCAAQALEPTPPAIDDNCGNAISPTGPTQGGTYVDCEGTITFTWNYEDCEGNSHDWVYTYTVEKTAPVMDTEASDETVECDGLGNTAALDAWLLANGGASASDTCGGTIVWTNDYTALSDDCGATGSASVTFTATDLCSGLATTTTAIFTIEDTTAPVMDTEASDETVECDGLGNTAALDAWLASNGGASASDTCGGTIEWTNDFTALSDDCGATGSASVTFTATDLCSGLATTTTAIFTIEDTTAPVMDTEAAPETVECDGLGNFQDLEDWLISNGGSSATDNCSDVTWSNDFSALSDDCGFTGSAIVTFTAIDDCGNEVSTIGIFTIEDTTAPMVIFDYDEDIEIACDDEIPAVPELEFEDSCSSTLEVSFEEESTFVAEGEEYEIIRTWTVTDECGNEEIYTQRIVILGCDVLGVVDFEIFNGITPDGDGLNDTFHINGIDRFPENTLQVYNRWGVLVYETDGYGQNGNVFRGISEGRVTIQRDRELPSGNYFYILVRKDPDNGEHLKDTGYLYINR